MRAPGHMNVPFYFWTWRDKFFHSIAIKAKLKHPCKSELFHLRSFYVMLKWMFLISGDGTAKHVPSSSRSQHNKSWAGAECVCTRADTKIDESLNDSEIFFALLSALTPRHVGGGGGWKSCRFSHRKVFKHCSHRFQPNARPLFVSHQRAFSNAAFSVTEV